MLKLSLKLCFFFLTITLMISCSKTDQENLAPTNETSIIFFNEDDLKRLGGTEGIANLSDSELNDLITSSSYTKEEYENLKNEEYENLKSEGSLVQSRGWPCTASHTYLYTQDLWCVDPCYYRDGNPIEAYAVLEFWEEKTWYCTTNRYSKFYCRACGIE